MARLGLKVFYLRTRELRLSQQEVAERMGVRQATLSNIERGVSLPSAPMVLELARFYDVTPTYLLDEDRGLTPRPTERWRLRNALVTVGMAIEGPRAMARDLDGEALLVMLEPGARFYDSEACDVRVRSNGDPAAVPRLVEERRQRDDQLEETLEAELKLHPRRRKPAQP